MQKIRKGDQVVVVSGSEKGKRGTVLRVIDGKVLVEGVNRVTRHEKITLSRRGAQEGGISHKEAAIDLSNVALVCPTDGPTRVGFRIDENTNAKERICKKCGTEL